MTMRRGSRNKRTSATRHPGERPALSLMVHGPEFGSGEELVLNPECFPDVKLGDLLEINQPDREHPRLILQVTSLAPVRGKLQISVLKDIAAQFGLDAFYDVVAQKIDPRDVTLDYIELTFKDQFLSRADIWRFKVAMYTKCVYVGKTIECLGVRAQVEGLVGSNQSVLCGVIGADTKMIVRSRSSRVFWLVQMSTEMWEFAADGELYYEKLLNTLLHGLIAKWGECSVSHSVTIIAFSRSYYDKDQFPSEYDPATSPFNEPTRQGFGPGCASAQCASGYGPTVHVDPRTGQYFEDFYKVLVMNYTGPDWNHLLTLLKNEFAHYHETHRWRTPEEFIRADYKLVRTAGTGNELSGTDQRHSEADVYVQWNRLPYGVPSRAVDGNILEAINVTLNILDKHYMDRDLNRTGQSILMLTAGCGVFNVDSKLSQITKQRMMDNGVGMDLISVATPPLHVVPLFIAHNYSQSAATDETSAIENESALRKRFSAGSMRSPNTLLLTPTEESLTRDMSTSTSRSSSYLIPHWVNVTFLDFDCRCSPEITRHLSPSTPLFTRHSNNNRLLSHRMNTCDCQVKLNQRFLPLPPFRMFDFTAPTERQSFPVALRSTINRSGNLNRAPLVESPVGSESEFLHENKQDNSHHMTSFERRRLSDFSDICSSTSSAKCLGPLQLCKSPDVELFVSPHLKALAPHVPSSIITREALQEYDAEVFTIPSKKGDESGSPKMRRVFSSAIFSPEACGADFSSATFTGDSLNLELAKSLPKSRWKSVSTHGGFGAFGETSSIVNSILSPRNNFSHPSGIVKRGSASRSLFTDDSKESPRQTTRSHTLHSSPIRVPPSPPELSSPDRRNGRDINKNPSPIKSNYNQLASPELTSKQSQNMKSPLGKSVDSSKTHMVSRVAQQQADTRNGLPPITPPLRPRATTSNDGTSYSEASHTPPMKSNQAMRSPSFACRSPQQLRLLGAPSPVELNASYHKHFLTGNGMQPSKRNYSEGNNAGSFQNSFPHNQISAFPSSHDLVSSSEVNPFRYSNETVESATAKLTSDRRRWSHLFPAVLNSHESAASMGDLSTDDFKQMYLGPNWKSLTSPAVLPLTTDFYPTPKDLYTNYTESFYTLTLPAVELEMFPKYKDHDELLIEMICQRLASDFQLVATDAGTDVDVSRHRVPAGTSNRGPSGESHDSRSNITTYHLSMGHRIHQIIYDAELQTIEVKRYFERASQSQHNEPTVYTYSLWVDMTQSFQPLQQNFYRYPMPEGNWNSLDHLLCGYHDEMTDMIKCRRIRFAILPPASNQPARSRHEYISRFMKFVEFLQSRTVSEGGVRQNITVRDDSESSDQLPLNVYSSLTGYKICCSSTASYARLKAGDTRNEWLMVHMEDSIRADRNYHFDIRWLACSGIIVDDFVATLRRKAKQAGVELRRIPEYSCISFLQIHPLIAPIYLPMSNCATHGGEHNKSIISVLVNRLDFVLDDERVADTNGIGYGLGLGKEYIQPPVTGVASGQRPFVRRFSTRSANDARQAERRRTRGYKQLMHRTAPVFLRLIQTGIVWIPGYDYDQLSTPQSVRELFLEVCGLIHTNSAVQDMVATCCGSEAA